MVDVLVVTETQGGAPSRNTLGVLGAARRLADRSQGTVKAAVMGGPVEGLAPALFARGADEVLWVEHSLSENLQPDAVVALLAQVVPQAGAHVVLMEDHASSREVAPRLAYRLQAGLVTEVTGIETEADAVVFRRPVYGGRCLAEIVATRFPVIGTVNPRTWSRRRSGRDVRGRSAACRSASMPRPCAPGCSSE